MIQRFFQRLIFPIFSLILVFGITTSPVFAYDNPDLLPTELTPVIDLARALTDSQNQSLVQELNEFETETGWKLRLLTQFDRTPGRAVKKYWGLDKRSLLVVADPRGGNLLNFNVGDEFYKFMPRTFWVELQTRFGNLYYVRDNGEDGSILDAIHVVEGCLRKGGCSVVPGLPQEQWILTLVTATLGGLVCGLAAHPRKPTQVFAWQWVLIFSPLWGILFVAFGIAPVITRTADWVPLVRNISGFLIAALVAYLSYQFRDPSPTSNL